MAVLPKEKAFGEIGLFCMDTLFYLGEGLFTEAQRKDYREFIKANIPKEQLKGIRYPTRTGRPFGGEEFIKSMERKLEKIFMLKLPGRPKKRGGR
jgi:hypothetical protein